MGNGVPMACGLAYARIIASTTLRLTSRGSRYVPVRPATLTESSALGRPMALGGSLGSDGFAAGEGLDGAYDAVGLGEGRQDDVGAGAAQLGLGRVAGGDRDRTGVT